MKRLAKFVAMLVALPACVAVAVSAPSAAAANPVVGNYTLHYEYYSAPGYWQTTSLVLKSDGTCQLVSGCAWNLSGAAFTMTTPNIRRNGTIYKGTVTGNALNSPSNPGYIYYGTTGASHEGLWYATRN